MQTMCCVFVLCSNGPMCHTVNHPILTIFVLAVLCIPAIALAGPRVAQERQNALHLRAREIVRLQIIDFAHGL